MCDAPRKNIHNYLETNKKISIFVGKKMKEKIILPIMCCFFLILSSCKESVNPANSSKGYLTIKNARHSFGKIKNNKVKEIKCYFVLANTGKNNIVIEKIDVSCGCIATEIPSYTIMPGKSQKLAVKINTKNKNGIFNKSIFIKSNAENSLEIIRVKGEIE